MRSVGSVAGGIGIDQFEQPVARVSSSRCSSLESDMRTERFDFPNPEGHLLTRVLQLLRPGSLAMSHSFALLHLQQGQPCRVVGRRGLVVRGIAVFRFDFTGLGSSEGEFANTDSRQTSTIVAAADRLRSTHRAPGLLIGHSLGGAAVLAAAARIRGGAVATISAPADPGHVANLFGDRIEEIRSRGEGEVELDGRVFRIR